MRKKLLKLSMALLCCVSVTTWAQQHVNTTFYDQQVQMFKSLDVTKVPTGILYEHSFPFTELSAFDGEIRDSLYVDGGTVKDMYKTIYTGVIDVNNRTLPSFEKPEVFEQNWYSMRNPDQVVLAGALFKYNKFKDNALEDKLVSISRDSAIIDIPGQNPYTEQYAMAIAPGLHRYYGKELNVVIPSSLFKSNEAANITSFEIDFNDGNGYRAVTANQQIPVTYTTEGTKEWRYKVVLTNGKLLRSRSRIKIIDWLDPVVIIGQNYCSPFNTTKKITATQSHLGEYGELNLTIRCSGDGIINNPLIVVEGFDIGNLFDPENEYGTTNIVSFRRSLSESTELKNLLENSNRQYDLIYVDWVNGMDYMERNAFALEEAIKWVNSIKQGNEPNVILGQSMGGVVARFALTNMENHNEDHDTNLFISHDAPQQGAMVPDSYQHMYRHITNQYIKVSNGWFGSTLVKLVDDDFINMANGVSGLLNQPAAKQLLKVWIDDNHNYNSIEHNNFYTMLRQMNSNSGYPALTRNISLSNGSECGTTQNGVELNSHLIDFHFRDKPTFVGGLWRSIISPLAGIFGGLLFEDWNFVSAGFVGLISTDHEYTADLEAKVMKDNGLAGNIYHAKFRYRFKVFGVFRGRSTFFHVNKNGRSYNPYEYYSGGNFQLYNENDPVESAKFGNTNKYTLSVSPRFGFIPTVSGLDIGGYAHHIPRSEYLSQHIGENPPSGTLSSPFDNFSTDFNKTNHNHHNYRHITFNPRNGKWLANELNQARNQTTNYTYTNCEFFCDGSIFGADAICGNNEYTYSIPQIANAAISWSAPGLTIVSGQGTSSVTVKSNGTSGTKTIKVTINSTECGYKIIEKQVHVGVPTMSGEIEGNSTIFIYPSGGWQVSGLPANYTAPEAIGATYYEWELPGNYQEVSQLSHHSEYIFNWELLASTANSRQIKAKSDWHTDGQIKVRACNDCGCSDYITLDVEHIVQNYNGGIGLSPNPVGIDGSIQVYFTDATPPVFRNDITDGYIYDMQTVMRKSFQISSKGTTIDISGLQSGVYIVVIDMQDGTTRSANLQVNR